MSKHKLVFKILALVTLQIFIFTTSASAYPTLDDLSKVKKELRAPAKQEDPEELVESLGGNSVKRFVKDETILDWSINGKSLEEILSKIVKEYDVRGFDGYGEKEKYPQQFDDKLLVWMGRALGTAEFTSTRHGQTVSLKPGDTFLVAGDNGPSTEWVKENIISGLRETGINIIDLGVCCSGELYSNISRFGAQGGLYVTRSHVEIGTNGFKPVIGGITLYGDMLQALKKQILSTEYRKADKLGTIDISSSIREKSREMYIASLLEEFDSLNETLDKFPMKIAINFGGGSAVSYRNVFEELLGEHLVKMFRVESDPLCEKGGLPDPSRSDDTALSNEKCNIMKYSKENPDVIIMNFDLDADRISIVWGGNLHLGDEEFYPVIEYQLSVDDYKELNKTFYYDSRMKTEIRGLIEYFGGVAKIHPKGHSKVKASIDLLLRELAEKENLSLEEFLSRHRGYINAQAEYSLHMFLTNDRGEPFDDAVRFSLFWLKIFSAIKEKYKQPNWTLTEYIQHLKNQEIIEESVQLKEQRTPMIEEAKKEVMLQMERNVQDFFAHKEGFELIENWQEFEGSKVPFTLVEVEGVFHLMSPLGDVFWGWSNTSPKAAFGCQSTNIQDLKKLSEIVVALWVHSRNQVAEKLGLELSAISDGETAPLRELFGYADLKVGAAKQIEADCIKKYPDLTIAMQSLLTSAEKEKRYALDKDKLKGTELTQEFIQDLAKTAEILRVKSSTLLSLMQEGVRPEVFVDKLAGVTGIEQAKAALGAEKAFQAILSRYELGELKSAEAVRNPAPWEIPLLTQEAARDYAVETSIKGIEFSLPEGDVVDKEKVAELKKYHRGIVELTRDKEQAGEFSHRGNVKEYIKHFKKDVVPELKGFINDNFNGNWRKVKYVVLSGIGGNEMSNHNLAAIQRKLVKEGRVKSGIEFYVLSNPAEMVRLPAEADGNNTIFIHMSRSGETGETIKTLEFLREKFPKCIICANKGPLRQLAEKFNLFNLPFGEDEVKIGGRMMRRKTITGYAALWLSLGGNEKYFDEYVEAADKCDNLLSFVKGEESLAVQMGEFLHSAAVLSGRSRFILMLNDDMTDERFTGEKQFLKHSLYELVQLWSEGYGKEDNYAPLEFINYSQDKEALPGIMAQADSCCGLVVLDRKNTNYREAKKQAKAMAEVMPLVIIEIEGMDFETAAALSSLYEDVITFMCTCENVDINANPGVKAVREESGRVLAGEEGKEAGEEATAKQIGEITTIGEVKPDTSLLAFAGQIEGLAKSLKIDIPELLKIYRDSFDNYNLFLNILEKAGGMAYQRAVALLEANDSFDYVVKGYKEVRTERQAEKEREVPGQVQELVKEIQENAGKYNISLELGAVKVDEEWLGERRKLHRGLRKDDKDVLVQELAEFMDIAINTPDSKIGDIATVVSDIFQQDLGNKFKHSWMNSVVPAQDVFNELHIFTRASHHTFETILDNPEAYFFFGLVAQKQEAPEDRQDLEWLFEKVLEKDDVENPKHAGLSVGKMNRRLANANYTSLWRKGLPGLSIEFEKLTKVEEEKLGELCEKIAKHYRNILKEAELARWAGISELKGIIAEIVKKKEDGREKEELPAGIEEEVDSIINARRILSGLFTSEELEGVYSRDGKNIQKGRKNIVLDNIEKLAELMKKKMPPSSDLDYIIKNFVPAVEVLLENERMKKLANSEVDKIYLWLSGMVSNQLYKDIKKEQNERGKGLYGKLKPSIAKLSKEKGEKEALKYALMYATLGNMLEDKYFSKEAVSDESFKEIEERCLVQKDFFEALEENLKRLEELKNRKGLIKYYIDNAGEFYLDLLAIRLILERGLGVVVLAQDKDVNNDDLSVENVMEILTQCLEEEEFSWLKEYYNPDDPGKGQLRVMSNNSQSYGVNLNYASAEHKKLRDNGLIIYKGGVNANYSTMMVEKINSFHLSALKQEDQKAIAYLLGFDKNKIIEGNLMFYQVKKGEKGPDLQDLLKAKDERSYFARKEAPSADFAKAFPNANAKLNKEKLTEPMAFIIVEALNGTEIAGTQNGKKYYLNASLPYPDSPDYWEVKVYYPDLRNREQVGIEIGKIVGIATDEPEEGIGIFISNMAIDKGHREQGLSKGIIGRIAKIVSQGSILEGKIREIETLKDLYFHIIYEKGFSLPEMFKHAPGKINELIEQIEELNDKTEPSRALGSTEPAKELIKEQKEVEESLENWLVSIIGEYLIDNQIEFDTLKKTILGKIWANAGFKQELHIYSVPGDFPAVFIKGEKTDISDFKSFWAKDFRYINVQLNKEKLTEPMAFIIDPALIGDNPSIVLAIQNLKEQLRDKIKIVFQHSQKSEKLGAEALYEAIKEATDGTVDLKGKVDLDVPAKASAEEVIKWVNYWLPGVKEIKVIGRREWTEGFQNINIKRTELEKITLVVCKIGEGNQVVQGDLAVLLGLKDTGFLQEKEIAELNRCWGKGGTFFIVETKEIAEEMEYIEKYQEALEKFE